MIVIVTITCTHAHAWHTHQIIRIDLLIITFRFSRLYVGWSCFCCFDPSSSTRFDRLRSIVERQSIGELEYSIRCRWKALGHPTHVGRWGCVFNPFYHFSRVVVIIDSFFELFKKKTIFFSSFKQNISSFWFTKTNQNKIFFIWWRSDKNKNSQTHTHSHTVQNTKKYTRQNKTNQNKQTFNNDFSRTNIWHLSKFQTLQKHVCFDGDRWSMIDNNDDDDDDAWHAVRQTNRFDQYTKARRTRNHDLRIVLLPCLPGSSTG